MATPQTTPGGVQSRATPGPCLSGSTCGYVFGWQFQRDFSIGGAPNGWTAVAVPSIHVLYREERRLLFKFLRERGAFVRRLQQKVVSTRRDVASRGVTCISIPCRVSLVGVGCWDSCVVDELASQLHFLALGALVVVLVENVAGDVAAIRDDFLRRAIPEMFGDRATADAVGRPR